MAVVWYGIASVWHGFVSVWHDMVGVFGMAWCMVYGMTW